MRTLSQIYDSDELEDVAYSANQLLSRLRSSKNDYQDDLKSFRKMIKLLLAMGQFEDNIHVKTGGVSSLMDLNPKDIARKEIQEIYNSLRLKHQRFLIKNLHNIEEALYKRGAKMDLLDM